MFSTTVILLTTLIAVGAIYLCAVWGGKLLGKEAFWRIFGLGLLGLGAGVLVALIVSYIIF